VKEIGARVYYRMALFKRQRRGRGEDDLVQGH